MILDLAQHLLVDTREQRLDLGKARLDPFAIGVQPVFMNGDLDARLVLVVAATQDVVNADDCFEIGQQVLGRQEVANDLADHRGPAQAAAHKDLVTRITGGVAHHAHADVMGAGHGAVIGRPGHGEFEFPR